MRSQAPALGLRADALRAEYVLNWGGFVNMSFRVGDGVRAVHVKLASTAETLPGLRRWRALHEPLAGRHRAPPMLGWVELPAIGAAGPVFPHLPGAPPTVPAVALLAEVAAAVRRLHDDAELAARLRALGDRTDRRCADCYLGTYHERFTADLGFVAAARPPFVHDATLAWMHAEAAALARLVREAPAFQEPAARPVHADLWTNNLLVAPDGRWWILDWDGLELGDPMMDLAMLAGPSPARLDGFDAAALAPALGEPERRRLALYARAALLDWVIDPLADWIDAAAVPASVDEVRPAKRRTHEAALALYRARYGGGGA